MSAKDQDQDIDTQIEECEQNLKIVGGLFYPMCCRADAEERIMSKLYELKKLKKA